MPLTLAYEEVLNDPGADPEFGERDLRVTLADAGIGLPRWPTQLARQLARRDRWYWSTAPVTEQPHRMQDYLMDERDFLLGPVADHLTISHGGHSINSYALSVRAVHGPLALHVQEAFGGGYSDSASDCAAVTELLHRVGALLRSVGDTPASERKQARVVVLHLSSFRGIAELRLWDHELRTWQEQHFDPTGHEIWSRAEMELEQRRRPQRPAR